MTQSNYSVVTNYGRSWNARAAAGEEVSPIVAMVFGDGDRLPTGGETALENQVHRQTLSGQGSYEDESAAFFDAYLEGAIGGFIIREHGLVTADGNLVAIGVRNPGIPKADPATGAADDFTYRIDLFFDQLDALVVEIDPLHGLTAERRVNTGYGLKGGGALDENLELSVDHSNLLRPPTQKWVLTSDWQENTNAANGPEQIVIGQDLEKSIKENHSDAIGVIVAGDITDEGAYPAADLASFTVPPTTHKSQRRRFDGLMRGSVGVVALLGNHDWSYVPPEDDPEEGYSDTEFLRHFPATRFHLEIGNVNFLMMSDEKKGTRGYISDDTVEWWDEVIQAKKDQGFTVCVSHQLVAGTIDADDPWENRDIEGSERFTDRMTRGVRPSQPSAWISGHQGSYSVSNAEDRYAMAFGVPFFQVGAHIPSIAGDVPARPAVYWTMELVEGSVEVTFKQWGVLGEETTLHSTYVVQSPVPIELGMFPKFDGRHQRHNRFDTEVTNMLATTARNTLQSAQQEIRLRKIEGKRTAKMENGL